MCVFSPTLIATYVAMGQQIYIRLHCVRIWTFCSTYVHAYTYVVYNDGYIPGYGQMIEDVELQRDRGSTVFVYVCVCASMHSYLLSLHPVILCI